MPICAYCGLEGPMTREHVVPNFLYDFVDREAIGGLAAWNEPSKTLIQGEHKVKDVCANCNNVRLSALDNYGRRFLEGNGLLKPLYVSRLRLDYDYHLLMRWLLKIQFNSARASRFASHPASILTKYILHGRPQPDERRVFLAAELLRPHQVTEPDSPHIASTNKDGLSNPFLVKISGVQFSDEVAAKLKVDCTGFGGMYFHVVYIASALSDSRARKMRARVLRDNSRRLTALSSTSRSMVIHASDRDFVEIRAGQEHRIRTIEETGEDPCR